MELKVIISRYVKSVYRDINGIVMSLVSVKNLTKSRRISPFEVFSKMLVIKKKINTLVNDLLRDLGDFYKWIDTCYGNQTESATGDVKLITVHERIGDNPGEIVTINKDSITSVERHYSGGALIEYEDKNVITWEKFNEIVVELGLEVEYVKGRYVSKKKSKNSTTLSSLIENLNGILEMCGDMEIDALFTVVRNNVRNVGNIDETLRFCKQEEKNDNVSG